MPWGPCLFRWRSTIPSGGSWTVARGRGRERKAEIDNTRKRTLVCGIGNPGRGDDGLGPEAVARLEREGGLPADGGTEVVLASRLQLNVEDALTFSEFDRVIIVDATRKDGPPFALERLEPEARVSFSTHALSPGAVLAWCRDLYGRVPSAYVLAVRGVSWEPGDALSPQAEGHLRLALKALETLLGQS